MAQQKFDFDQIIERRGTGSMKWDIPADSDIIPLWVADMDFATAPVVRRAIEKRAAHGIFGYATPGNEFYQAAIGWFGQRHGWRIEREWMLYTSGVVPAMSAIIKALTQPGDSVIVFTPVYNCFFSSIRNQGCGTIECGLRQAGDTWEIDWDAFEAQAARPDAKILLFCSPHNPVGRVWRRDELERVVEICHRNGVVIISDEIHNELVMPGYKYIPTASISQLALDTTITCVAPSKSFNIAGLQTSLIVTNNAEWRSVIDRAINDNETCDIGPFGIDALIAAYSPEGAEWLDALDAYLWDNYQMLKNFFESKLPQFAVTRLEGTYLAWVDISATGLTSDAVEKKLLDEGHVWVTRGTAYGQRDGEGFIRINMACPRARLQEGLERIARVLNQ